MKRKPDGWAKDIPTKGDLIVLQGGPNDLDGSWWWLSEFEAHQTACLAVHHDWRTRVPNAVCGYRRSGRVVGHPAEVLGSGEPVTGRVWEWTEPA